MLAMGDHAAEQETSTQDVVSICRRRVQDFRQLPAADREDVVQQAVSKVLEAIAQGVVTNTAAYARRVAYHCAVDAWRRARDTRELDGHEEEGIGVASAEDESMGSLVPPTPEQLTREKHRIETLAGIADELRALLASAPDNYRRILVQHYLEERSFESLVDDELARRVDSGALPAEDAHDPALRKRVRNAVHAWHSRALRWLQQRAPDAWREVTP